MKRVAVFILVLSLLVVGGTLVSAEGQTRRHRSKFGRKARTVAIIAGGAGVGALVAGRKGAAIGAGAPVCMHSIVAQQNVTSAAAQERRALS